MTTTRDNRIDPRTPSVVAVPTASEQDRAAFDKLDRRTREAMASSPKSE